MGSAERALAALVDGPPRPVVTNAFLGLCGLVTIASLIDPELYAVFGGVAPRTHWWQPVTAVFEHGWAGMSGAVHLALNAFLLLQCGPPCERLLGSGRFMLLGLASLGANAFVLSRTDGVNGSSLVIWSFGPPLYLALRWARARESTSDGATFGRLRGLLVLMYGVIVVVMALVPYAAGWRGHPVVSLLRANVFHGVATGVGVLFAWIYRDAIRGRLERLGSGHARP